MLSYILKCSSINYIPIGKKDFFAGTFARLGKILEGGGLKVINIIMDTEVHVHVL